jgi:hypothetical protein
LSRRQRRLLFIGRLIHPGYFRLFFDYFSDPFFGRISRVHLTILAGNYVTKLFSMMLDRSQSSRDAKGSVREA